MSLLHIANGTATTSLLDRAGLPGDKVIWADVLHEGPVPGDLSDDELRMVRARYLSDRDADFKEVLASLTATDRALAARDARGETILWFEHDLFDQLNLIQLLARVLALPPSSSPLSLVMIDRFPGRPSFKGLGELTPQDLASLFEERRPVSDAQLDAAARAWTAFRSTNPQRIEQVLGEDLSPLPFLHDALGRHLEEFPSTANGLSRTEQQLMQLAAASPIGGWDAFLRLHDAESCFFIGDLSFLRIVRELATLSPSLLTLDGDDLAADRIPRMTISVTPAGQSVLSGSADRVRDWGIDRWLGGVHLEWREPLWRWDHLLGRLVVA